jgi:hypothetical protein
VSGPSPKPAGDPPGGWQRYPAAGCTHYPTRQTLSMLVPPG